MPVGIQATTRLVLNQPMLTLFALVKDDADAITTDTLVRDLQHKLALAKQFAIKTETLVFPRVTGSSAPTRTP